MRARQRRLMKRRVLVLNSSFEVLTYISWERAITHVISGVARVIDSDENTLLHTAGGLTFPYPSCIIMKNYVKVNWQPDRMDEDIAAKSAILTRDGFMCMYCGEHGSTIDHIVPQSQGGANTWENLVCACQSCNSLKADKSLADFTRDTGLSLIREPFKPLKASRRDRAQEEIYRRLASGDIKIVDDFEDEDDNT